MVAAGVDLKECSGSQSDGTSSAASKLTPKSPRIHNSWFYPFGRIMSSRCPSRSFTPCDTFGSFHHTHRFIPEGKLIIHNSFRKSGQVGRFWMFVRRFPLVLYSVFFSTFHPDARRKLYMHILFNFRQTLGKF